MDKYKADWERTATIRKCGTCEGCVEKRNSVGYLIAYHCSLHNWETLGKAVCNHWFAKKRVKRRRSNETS